MNWELFIGRFHPVIVHLPIGIFILGFIFEVLFQLGYRKLINSRKVVIITYGIGLIMGVFAALSGWLLSLSNDYGIAQLNDHKQLGFITLGIMLLVILFQIKAPSSKTRLKLIGSTTAIILTVITGHLGGNLTHGTGYLSEYGPSLFKNDIKSEFNLLYETQLDSVLIYRDILNPLIQSKCLACHNSKNSLGGLKLESYSDLFKEADNERPIIAGNPFNSELFNRLSLPLDNDKVMPPKDDGFSYTETQIIKYWIEQGADSLAVFDSKNMSNELITLVNRDYGLDFSQKSYYEKVKVDSLDEKFLTQLRNSGFSANYLGQENYLLDVTFKGDTISKTEIELLSEVSGNVTFLKLSKCQLSNDLFKEIGDLPHLTKLDISNNAITNDIIRNIGEFTNLESVNLNETQIGYEGLNLLLGSANLSRVYVWQSKITEEDISNLKLSYQNVELISEFKFEEFVPAKSVFYNEEDQ